MKATRMSTINAYFVTLYLQGLKHYIVRCVFEWVQSCECDLHVLRSIREELGVLRRRVFWAVRGSVTDDHHDGTVRVHLLGDAEKVGAVVGDQICEIVLERREKPLELISAPEVNSHLEKGKSEGGVEGKMHNNTSFDKISFAVHSPWHVAFPPSSHFQINGEGPVGIWTGAIEYTTVPICRVNSWQPAGVCVSASVCVPESVCMCIQYMGCCLINESLHYWMWHRLMVRGAWRSRMVCCYDSSQPPLLLSGLFPFSYLASFDFIPLSLNKSSFLCLSLIHSRRHNSDT